VKTYIPTLSQLNELLNVPGVRPPTVPSHITYLDATDFLSEPRNVALAYQGGCAMFEHLGRGVYEGHMFAQPGHRGAEALEFGKLAVKWLFEVVNASKLIVMAPNQLPEVLFYCRKLGMESLGKDLFQEHFQLEAMP
jgi:hypothetical protein